MRPLTRRQTLVGALAAIAATGCDFGLPGDGQGSAQPTATAPTTPAVARPYLPLTVSSLPPAVQLPLVVIDLAGSGEFGDAGDGQAAALAQFRSIGGVAVDPQGRVYISDPQANRVRRIGADGVIQTVAGTGIRGSAGDGGPATQAELTEPTRLLVDGAGVLLIGELHRVRRVAPDGTITTVIGDGQPGVEGDGGPASLARLAANAGMALDGEGTLFIAERAAHRVRRIGPDGIVTTMAGTGVAGSAGDGGAAASAQLNQPVDVDVDAFANILIAELGGNRIRRVSGQSSVAAIHTLAGTGEPGNGGDGGAAVSAQLHGPQAVAVDTDGNVFVADWNNRRIRRIDSNGGITTIAGDLQQPSASGRLAVDTRMELPSDVTVTTRGELLVVEQGTRRLRALVPIAQIPAEPEAPAAPPYRPPAPAQALPPPVAGELIADVFAGRGEPGYDGEGGLRQDAQFTTPRGIAVDGFGRVLIADTGNHRVRRIERDGAVRTVAGTGDPGFSGDGGLATAAQLNRPHHVTVDAQGALYIADAGNFRVRRVSPEGVISTMVGGSAPGSAGDGGPATFASLTEPVGVALDPSGRLYVVDAPDHRVRRVEHDGTIVTFAGTGNFGSGGDGGPSTAAAVGFPQRVVVDASGGVLISQLQAGVVRRVRGDGSIELAAGSSDTTAPDEGPAGSVRIEAPIGLAADAAGGFYVVESGAGTVTAVGGGAARVIAGDPTGSGQPGGPAGEIPLFTAIDIAIAHDGSVYLLEGRGIVWRIAPPGQPLPTEITPSPTPETEATPEATAEAEEDATAEASPSPTIPPAANESATIEAVTLALDLDSAQNPVEPTLQFHPGERVNVSVEFTDIVQGTRLGIRWNAGNREIGRFLTDPVGASPRATYGFWFFLPPTAATGQWSVEVLVGSQVVSRADFVVVAGEVRIQRDGG